MSDWRGRVPPTAHPLRRCDNDVHLLVRLPPRSFLGRLHRIASFPEFNMQEDPTGKARGWRRVFQHVFLNGPFPLDEVGVKRIMKRALHKEYSYFPGLAKI